MSLNVKVTEAING
jgi:CheY-like chemotaxis protein